MGVQLGAFAAAVTEQGELALRRQIEREWDRHGTPSRTSGDESRMRLGSERTRGRFRHRQQSHHFHSLW